MTPILAFLIFTSIVVALIRTTTGRRSTTFASWVVLIWVAVGASRPVTTWFSSFYSSSSDGAAESYDSGNPLERNFYIILIIAGIIYLFKRRFSFGHFIKRNRAIAIYALFCGLSVLWADYSVIAFKRWIRDSGTLLMVLVLLTEPDPVAAFRIVFVRTAYILIPYSVMLIRYFGDLGRIYSIWDGQLMNVGVTSHKNTLGMLALVSILFLAWDLIETYRLQRPKKFSRETVAQLFTLLASAHILQLSHSATSLVCTVLGLSIFCGLHLPWFRANIGRVRVYAVVGGVTLAALNSAFDLKGEFLKLVGRDPTLTTRTEVWPILLQHQTSPILGPGFKSFWAGTRLTHLWEDYGIIQAHNGYLETYLSGGLVGVSLLLILLFAGFLRANAALNLGTSYGFFRITIWTIVVIHNFTEASYNTFSPLWIALLVVIAEPAFRKSSPLTPARP